MSTLPQFLIKRQEYTALALMLGFLHLSVLIDFGSPISQSLLLIHLGLFLIWQPLQRGDEQLVWYNSILFFALTLSLVYWINWWLISGWLVLLIGIVGGRVVINRTERYVYMLVMIFLVSELLIGCIPRLFNIPSIIKYYDFIKYGITVIPILLLVFPRTIPQQSTRSVDLLHAITAALLPSLLALGSLVVMYHNGTDYFTALMQTLFAIGLCLFGISWLLTPHSGFSGLAQLWSRSLLSIGTPFEQWLVELSQLRQEKDSAEEFLQAALKKLVSLPWIAGVEFGNPDIKNTYGEITKYKIDVKIHNEPVQLYTQLPIGGALLLHCNLLIQLIDNFHTAKINERNLAKQAHLQAIHETGARITHDIKNLLQSMHSMITILNSDTENVQLPKSFIILKKQFPYFVQRLELAMNKLKMPDNNEQENVNISNWWQDLKSRYREFDIEFKTEIEQEPSIPADLFNSAVENLLENAIEKQKTEQDITITVSTIAKDNMICFMVSDTGSAVDEKVTRYLFKEPVDSNNGLGIGLYQVAKQAESYGYTLTLKYNLDGNVCFELLK